jgi:hypothetical protein
MKKFTQETGNIYKFCMEKLPTTAKNWKPKKSNAKKCPKFRQNLSNSIPQNKQKRNTPNIQRYHYSSPQITNYQPKYYSSAKKSYVSSCVRTLVKGGQTVAGVISHKMNSNDVTRGMEIAGFWRKQTNVFGFLTQMKWIDWFGIREMVEILSGLTFWKEKWSKIIFLEIKMP